MAHTHDDLWIASHPWSFGLVNTFINPSPTYLKPGWDEKPTWNIEIDTAKEDTEPIIDVLNILKKTRRLKNFTINIKDFTALLQGNCWLRCKGFPKGATVVNSLTVGNNIQLTVYHTSFPQVPVTKVPPTIPCDTKQFVRKGKKKDKVQQ